MYKLTEEKTRVDGVEYTLYGIVCEGICVKDISTEKTEVERLLKLINNHKLEPIHLLDVLEDYFGEN